jgi:hypothetical protein
MHVCAGADAQYCGSTQYCSNTKDPSGNLCCWTSCGLGGSTVNQYFGGCLKDNNRAGVLCCLN